MLKALVDEICQLEKFPGKGGWTYAHITEVPFVARGAFGMVKVYGSIDNHAIEGNLMPMENGNLFLPVNGRLRKLLNKTTGDRVHLLLFSAAPTSVLPPELQL